MDREQAEIAADERKIGVALEEFREMQSGYSDRTQHDKVNIQPRIVRGSTNSAGERLSISPHGPVAKNWLPPSAGNRKKSSDC